jgi:hypothetical protein
MQDESQQNLKEEAIAELPSFTPEVVDPEAAKKAIMSQPGTKEVEEMVPGLRTI